MSQILDNPLVDVTESEKRTQFRLCRRRESVFERRSMRLISLEFFGFDDVTEILNFVREKLHFSILSVTPASFGGSKMLSTWSMCFSVELEKTIMS